MFQLGPYAYASKDELKCKLKSFLQQMPEGIISQPANVEKLHYLICLHPRAQEKMGCGISHFEVARNRQGSGSSLVVVRTDGTSERFSYKACIDGQTVSNRAKALEALRFSVRSQMIEFRSTVQLPAICAISQRTITSREDMHIDHKIPFCVIVQDFCSKHGFNLGHLLTRGNGETLQLEDSKCQQEFQRFHRVHAQLQATSKAANLEKGAKLES